jgi:hypothetical protein
VGSRGYAASLLLIGLVAAGCTTVVAPSARPDTALATPTPLADVSSPPMSPVRPAPTPVATMASPPPALATVEPVEGTTLPLAGRDGAPGLVLCGALRPTTLEAIHAAPAGAEARIGPEYDILRATIERYGDDPEFGFLGQTFREFRLDATNVTFLGSNDEPEGPYSSIDVAFSDGAWRWSGMTGGCKLTGVPGPEWGSVNWTLDTDFDPPTEDSRTLHLLATDSECVGDASLEGRLAPAWVFLQPNVVWVQLFATRLEPGAECTDQEPTKITVRLPEPLGRRELIDTNPLPCRGCGG